MDIQDKWGNLFDRFCKPKRGRIEETVMNALIDLYRRNYCIIGPEYGRFVKKYLDYFRIPYRITMNGIFEMIEIN